MADNLQIIDDLLFSKENMSREWSPELLYCAGFLPCDHPRYEEISTDFAKAMEELRMAKQCKMTKSP